MKKVVFLMTVLAISLACHAQQGKYSTFYDQRATLFEELPITSKDVVFLGNSITNGAEWAELLNNKHVKNRGISGDICMGVYDRLDAILKGNPAKIFLLIGINDVSRGTLADTIVSRIRLIAQKIKKDSPKTKLYLQSVLPVTDHYKKFTGHTSRWQVVPEINKGLLRLAEEEGVTYIDLYSHFVDQTTGKMNTEYTNDGVHLLGKGYLKWVEIVKPYIGQESLQIQSIHVQKMSGFPDGEKGMNLGLSACYAGITGGQLLICGGCNFPGTPAAEGGKKKYYKGIYVADIPANSLFTWRKVGDLPASAAYGVTVSTGDGVICIGGMNEKGAMTDVFRIYWKDDKRKKVVLESLPSLPYALDNFTGSLSGNRIYVAGGNKQGIPSNSFLCLDLDKLSDGWQELPSFPGSPRVQPVSASQWRDGERCFYLWGGFAPSTAGRPATLSLDGYCYSPSSQTWTRLDAPAGRDGEAVSLGGGTSHALGDKLVLCMGGVNKDIFLSALQKPEKDYLLHPAEWYKFNRKILVYDISRNAWQEVLETSDVARAGAALVGDGETFFSIAGELKPGIRTAEIISITIK